MIHAMMFRAILWHILLGSSQQQGGDGMLDSSERAASGQYRCPVQGRRCWASRLSFEEKVARLNQATKWTEARNKWGVVSIIGRIDVHEAACDLGDADPVRESVAVIVPCSSLRAAQGATVNRVAGLEGSSYQFCCDSPYRNELAISGAFGTGVVVANDHLLTAAHVAFAPGKSTEGMCAVFGWVAPSTAVGSKSKVANGRCDVRRPRVKDIVWARDVCVIDRVVDHGERFASDSAGPAPDWALLHLSCDKDHPRERVLPLALPSANENIEAFGFPFGVAMKHASNATFIDDPSAGSSVATSFDAVSGFSGSPVLQKRDGVLVVVGLMKSNGRTKLCDPAYVEGRDVTGVPADCRLLDRRGRPVGELGGDSCKGQCQCVAIPRCWKADGTCEFVNRVTPSGTFIDPLRRLELEGLKVRPGPPSPEAGAK